MKKSVLVWVVFAWAAGSVAAQQKYALVMGNGAYTNLSRLNNPVNDANDMNAALRALGFTVDMVVNGGRVQMEEAVERFKNRLSVSKSSYGFLFYAGHGVQSGGVNYLIPVDADIRTESYLRDRAVSVQAILNEINDAGNELNIIVLDACRDNPFSWGRSGSRGLQVVDNQPADSIIVYATSAGSVAADGEGRNGVFTAELLKNLKTPGLDVNEVFRRTGGDVARTSGGKQRPAVYNQFYGIAYLGSRPSAQTAAAPTQTAQPARTPPAQTAAAPPVRESAAQDFETKADGNGLTIAKYTGEGGAVIIPASIGGKSVTTIGDFAFSGCTSLTSVTIPDSVTSIGDSAFWNCSSLTSVTISNSVTSIGEGAFSSCSKLTAISVQAGNRQYKDIDGVLFTKDSKTLHSYPAGMRWTAYTIPSSVTDIGWQAFYGCRNLASVTIPSSVTYIGVSAFWGCKSLTAVTIPSSITSIDCGAFEGCSGLTAITIPKSVTSIGTGAFLGCTSLKPQVRAEIEKRFGEEVFEF